MKKAERIFNACRWETKKHIEYWGYDAETDGGWSGGWASFTVTDKNPDGELIHQRTYNALDELLKRKETELRLDAKFDILTPERLKLEIKILQMMKKTAKNTYIADK
jgi:hypothetical protein